MSYVQFNDLDQNYKNSIMLWLITLTIMVFLIIIIGGLTRLTDSGLSMVDWQPILGTIPPLNNNQWQEVFNDYKLTPEFLYVNKNMTLDEFKYIFWWEWFHRFFARLIGLVFIIPFIYFLIKKNLNSFFYKRFSIIFSLGLFQALVGWWMVKSGLSDDPFVSPYRLTFHLTNAVIIYALLLWTSVEYFHLKSTNFISIRSKNVLILISIILVFVTILSGGFMAGSHAGQSFNTYPLMNGKIIPDDIYLEDLGFLNMFENTVTINFNHRWIATITFIYTFSFFSYLIFKKVINLSNQIIISVLLILTLQFLLGIMALLSNVSIYYGSLHQTNSIALLSILLVAYFKSKITGV
jgi:cytochrome c oxidase assembly protein subunit 15|tara:strand:- start:2179 stop:3231 length:1053 start_codon:yes stop_codon:yes gene_type:complete